MKIALWLTPLAFLSAFLIHVGVSWTFGEPGSRQRQAAWVCAVNTIAWMVSSVGNAHGLAENLFVTLTAAGFSSFYFLLWNCTETARRVKILVASFRGDSRSLALYSPALMIEERLSRLEAMGALRNEDGRFYCVPGILLASALFFAWWREIFRCEAVKSS